MSICLIICLAGVICRADGAPVRERQQVVSVPGGTLLAQREYSTLERLARPAGKLPNRVAGISLAPAQQRILVKRILQEQIKIWRAQARKISLHLAQQALEEKPELTDVDIGSAESAKQSLEFESLVRKNLREVALQFVREMRIPADPWEQAYVGRAMVALLERAHEDQLADQDRLLVQVLVSGPKVVRELPEPSVRFPPTRAEDPGQSQPVKSSDGQVADKNSEAYLLELRRARQDAEQRNAQDERIMWTNRAVEAFYRDSIDMMIRSRSPYVYKAVLERLNRQLRSGDAVFEQTIAALSRIQLSQLDLSQLKLMRAKLKGLAWQSRGRRRYTVYTEVQKQVRAQSSFEQRELDFSQSVQKLLTRLAQQIESSSQREPLGIRRRTLGPDD
ncbi:MAG: hypothetical protein GWP14_00600 [Actinobacteria bacterium]|nr:hypothetical protein [Actinomycetota bacterium]